MSKLPFVAILVLVLTVPLYNRIHPTLFGFPFFYWYQLVMVPFSSLLTYIVYRAELNGDTE